MKKFLRFLGKAVLVLLILVLLFALFLVLNGTCFRQFEGPGEGTENWMGQIADEIPLHRIAIPGSHDAGTAGMPWPGETQTYGVGEQLLSGARYFDLRVHKKGDGQLVIYHDIIDGQAFLPVLEEIRSFLETHPTETLLLDFQHFKDSQTDVLALLTRELIDPGLAVRNGAGIPDPDFIRALTLGDARGKCVIFWGDRSGDDSEYLFLRNNDGCTAEGTCLDSLYEGDLHKASAAVLIGEAFPRSFEMAEQKNEKGENGIFVLQAQLTDGLAIFGPWSKERGAEKEISAFIRSLAEDRRLPEVNVIMRDFLTPEKCLEIIELNWIRDFMMTKGEN